VKFKTDPAAAAQGVRTGINLVALSALVAQPVIPEAAAKILDALGVPQDQRAWPTGSAADLLDALPHGQAFQAPPILFQKIEDESVAEWTQRFGGDPET
jgi:methionyl-tRNA synthetase